MSDVSGCVSIDEFTLQAHLQVHEGIGGRTDIMEELHIKWQNKLPTDSTELAKWHDFEFCCCGTIAQFDPEGLTTAKAKRTNSVISPQQEAINHQTNTNLAELQDQMESVMSVIAQNQAP